MLSPPCIERQRGFGNCGRSCYSGKIMNPLPRTVVEFQTERLSVRPWSALLVTDDDRKAFAADLVTILTPDVTRALPPGWQNMTSVEDALAWIDAQSSEGEASAVLDRESGKVVGCLLLSPDGPDLRIGYFLAETAWGKGLGSELIGGLVRRCSATPGLRSLIGVVEESNPASMRLLEKNGFRRAQGESGPSMVVFEKILGHARHP